MFRKLRGGAKEAADTFSDNLQVGSERAKQLKKPVQPKIAHEKVTS